MVCKKDLLQARSFNEASQICETLKLGDSQRKLVEIAFANPQSRDVLLNTVIQEQHGGADPSDVTRKDAPKGDNEDTDHPTREENITHPRDSEGSSDSTEPYPAEGTDAPNSDIESSQTASGEDQMKEGLPPMGQPPMGQPPMQQMGQMPPVAPGLMNGMKPQLPPGLNPAVMQQMQYTVQRNNAPILKRMGKIEEALIAINKMVKETQAGRQTSMELNIPNKNSWFNAKVTKETTNDVLNFAGAKERLTPKSIQLDQKRNEIATLDRMMDKGPYK